MFSWCGFVMRRQLKTVWLFLLSIAFVISALAQEAKRDNAQGSQTVKEVFAQSFRDDRVRLPSIKHKCSGGAIGSSRLWLKVISMGDGVAKVGQDLVTTVEIHNGSNSPVEIPIAPSLREV